FTEEFPLGAYINHTKTRSSGIEMEFRYQGELGFIAANLATISGDGNRNEAYEVSTINDQFLAWPALKVNLYSGLRFIPDLIVSPSLSYLAKRYAVTGFGVSSFYSYTQVDPQFFINLNLQYTMSDQIDLNLYIKDITNQHQWFIQPHNSGFAPIEALGTEIVFGLSFHPSF
ncbi:MAG: TonB-dependent receptor, partial [Calditrichaeota bacterium]|nr:TonB-dependent receptor [Calditrichota bacterium]